MVKTLHKKANAKFLPNVFSRVRIWNLSFSLGGRALQYVFPGCLYCKGKKASGQLFLEKEKKNIYDKVFLGNMSMRI